VSLRRGTGGERPASDPHDGCGSRGGSAQALLELGASRRPGRLPLRRLVRESWTTTAGHRALPGTERPPTLVFDSLTAAHTDDPTNTTTWSMRLSTGGIAGTEGPTTAVSEDPPTQAAYAAVTAVLASHARWRLNGDTLVITGARRSSLSYTKNTARALALGTADVAIYARGYQPYPIAGTVSFRAPDQSVISRRVGEKGARLLRLVPARYKVTAVVKGGTCKPTSVMARGGEGSRLAVACLLGNRQPPGEYTAILVRLVVTEASGASAGQRNPGIGQVVVRNSDRMIVWHGKVTPWDGHPIFLKPGRYSVSAVITDGVCAGGATTVVTHHVSTLLLACKHTLSSY
jgi:hypothetical protein